MRIIFLNIWFGETGNKLKDFLKEESDKTDAFCFMEVTPELFSDLKPLFKNHQGLYEKGFYLKSWGITDGMAIFLKKGLKIKASDRILIYKNNSNDTGFAQYVELGGNGKSWHLLNVHGKTRPGHKMDTKARINQSKKIIEFMQTKIGPKIIGGDFNLMPNTKSVAMFEKVGYKNLIKDFDIKSTRNRLSWEQFKDHPGFTKQYFADYAFTSDDVKVKKFEVPNIEISDHLPLILDFEI